MNISICSKRMDNLEIGDWVLIGGKHIAKVYRLDHYGDKSHIYVSYWYDDSRAIHNAYISKNQVVKLDPALHILFKEKDDG